ncbi:MAG: tRNA guanosine(15) transglycosylase TgtA [Candidatus Thermoplasmatota archaeon]
MFELKDRDAAGRMGILKTKHGVVTTPTLLPVINPNKMLITPCEMKELFKTEMVITNSYIIYKNKELREKAISEGVHRLIGFDGPIMTDSGTFQSYVYNDTLDIDPHGIVQFQRSIGSDVGTILDVFGTPDQSWDEALESIQETIKRAKSSITLKGDMLLACTIQGSVHPDLRGMCAKELSLLDADLYPIGGVVPLMENQRYRDLVRCIISAKKSLNPSKPVHLFGAGHPLIFPLAVALGCDLFDSSAYAKYANDRRLILPWGTEKLDDLSELPCSCPVCSDYTLKELKSLEEVELTKEISKHNLYVSFTEIRRIRNAIHQGTLWELVERRASSNPYLLEAMRELRKKESKRWLERFEPVSKSTALFYTGPCTIHRPLIYRIHNRLADRYKFRYDKSVILPESKKPYSRSYSEVVSKILEREGVNIIVDSSLGPVPIELDEMYPFAQSVLPDDVDDEVKMESRKVFKRLLKDECYIRWEGEKTLKRLKTKREGFIDMDLWRLSSLADIQFREGAGSLLFGSGSISTVKSKTTGRIRNVYRGDEHILSLRAEDGLFTLKIPGAKLLHRAYESPMLRVIVKKEVASFIKEGRNVFTRFVCDCDDELRPFDECLIVDEGDALLGVGRLLLNRDEMLSFKRGVAVKTREGVKDIGYSLDDMDKYKND